MLQELRNFGYFILFSLYELFHLDYSRRKHLTISFVERKFKVKYQDHWDFIEDTQKILDKAKAKYKPKKFIEYALEQSAQCNYIIFSSFSDDKFLQFWQGDGKITLDYPMMSTNQLGRFKYQVLGLLAEMGFYKQRTTGKLLDYFFQYLPDGKIVYLKASFAHDIELTSNFIAQVISEFFKEDLSNVKATVG